MTKNQLMLGTLAAALGGVFASSASAQDAAAEAEVSASAPVGEETADSPEDEESQNPMGWFGIGLKLGLGGFGEGEFEIDNPGADVPGQPAKLSQKTPSRTGFQLAAPITMGGDGFGWVIEPFLNIDGDVTAGGFYTGPQFNIHVMDPLYVGFGFGPKLDYWLSADGIKYGADIGARVPLTATYYLYNDLGLLAELGLGYGMTGYVADVSLVDPVTGEEKDPDFGFGSAFQWDFSVGARWL